MSVFEQIINLLDTEGVLYEHLTHDHVHSSQDAAKVRNTRLEEAAKALVLKSKSGRVFQCIVSGHRKLDLRKIKELIGEKNCSLAHPDTVFTVTGCKVGTVPPFGNLFDLEIYADKDIVSREYIVFSAGTHHDSIRMKSRDWVAITGAQVVDIGKE